MDRITELEETLRAVKEKSILEKQKLRAEIMRLRESAIGSNRRGSNIGEDNFWLRELFKLGLELQEDYRVAHKHQQAKGPFLCIIDFKNHSFNP